MNRRHRHILLFIILIISGLIIESHAQSRYDSSFSEVAKRSIENLLVFTDRSMYAVNESILFTAFLESGRYPYHGVDSKVLYVELVNAMGTTVSKGKYLINESRSNGHLLVPSASLSGIYYLRCYTRWLRNFGPRYFTYIPIRVLNPYSTDVLGINSGQGKDYLSPIPKGAGRVSVALARHSYHPGELVNVQISLNEGNFYQLYHGCITVVSSGTIDTSAIIHRMDPVSGSPIPFKFNFLPEIKGTAISGIVLEQSSQDPASDTRIHFSVLGEEPAYFVTQSDQEGRFQVFTPSGRAYQEMSVVPEYQSGTPVEILIDNDFTSELLPFHPDTFCLNKAEQLLASKISLQMQLNEIFLTDSGIDNSVSLESAEPKPFYGKPEISVRIEDYIDMPNMEELFENLIPKTYLIRNGGFVHIGVENENPMILMFPPLILIDHVPVFDMKTIMAISPSKIDRIDVVPEVYVFGEVKYGGIISITSKQGDLAGIRLPEGSYFFDYVSYHPALAPQLARYSGPAKIPDTRNTLLWMDYIELSRDLSRKIHFKAAGVPGSYIILFRGISSDGEIVHGLNYFNVE